MSFVKIQIYTVMRGDMFMDHIHEAVRDGIKEVFELMYSDLDEVVDHLCTRYSLSSTECEFLYNILLSVLDKLYEDNFSRSLSYAYSFLGGA